MSEIKVASTEGLIKGNKLTIVGSKGNTIVKVLKIISPTQMIVKTEPPIFMLGD